MNKLVSYFFLLLIICSCSIRKERVIFPLTVSDAQLVIDKVNTANKIPEWLSLKGKVNLIKEERDITLNINIKCRKDSVVWASISAPFGIELFRTMLTSDSVYYINRTNKTYFIKPIAHISEVLKVVISFDEIQQMITATPKIINQNYQISSGADLNSTIISSKNIRYKIDERIFKILGASILDGNNELIYEFSDFINEEEFIFPKQFKLKVRSAEKFEATLNYAKVVFNKKQKIHFQIPISYVEEK